MKQLLKTAVKATILAGKEVLSQYQTDFKVYTKKDKSPVTTADLAANDILTKRLSATKIPILSEEGEHFTPEERASFDLCWVLDPIDGTKDFVNKTDEFCVCTGLVGDNTAKAGVLYAPALDLFYFAAEGIGSFKFDGTHTKLNALLEETDFWEPLISQSHPLPKLPLPEKFTFLNSRFYRDEITDAYIGRLKQKHPNFDLIEMGSAIKLGIIAERKATEYKRYMSVNFWDIAAGHAIAKYAGLQVNFPDTTTEIDYSDLGMRVNGYEISWA